MNLQLPTVAVADRVSVVRSFEPHQKQTFAILDGPGCIQHLFIVPASHPLRSPMPLAGRNVVMRIFFDDAETPHVEAPVADFFGVMHGLYWYPIDNHYLSVKAWNGYNCYFPMPFARSARIEFETGEQRTPVYLMVDWHRYPDQSMTEPRRFCARWRREMPTQRYGEDYLMLDADGPGQLLGFSYGVRLLDDADRWSHGGAENIYIDGDGEHPAYIRGIGGEDAFGAGYGGALHPPETHHYAAMPYYTHEDVGEARPAQRVVGYRFYERDTIPFQTSIQMRFGCMANDICSTVYWYQEGAVRPFFSLPDSVHLMPGVDLPRGSHDMPVPDSGSWWLCGPFGNDQGQAMKNILPAESEFQPEATFDGLHNEISAWHTEGSRNMGRDVARWVRRAAHHGFIDFNHIFRPFGRGVGKTEVGAAVARCMLEAPADMMATLRVTWDDLLMMSVNGEVYELGHHSAFRSQTVQVPLRAGNNSVVLKLSNDRGSNHGGWTFAFQAIAPGGSPLLPK